MKSFNYFFTPVGPEYKKKFARNVGIALLVLFAFYGIWNLIVDEVVSEHSMTFSAGNMTFHKELCIKNDGRWVNYQFDSKCYFETNTKYELAEIAFEEAGKTKITGDVGKKICIILDIPCPKDPKFDAWYDRDEDIATFTYYKNQERFTFIIEDTEIKYRTTQNEWKTFDHNILERFQDHPEVEAFYIMYPDALEEIRDDHVSYFAGSEDGYHVRMNMFFDENYELEHMDFHCYYQREHQFEFPQEDIATKIEKYECKKSSSGT